MTEIKVKSNLFKTVSILEQTVGPRRYWLHNQVGGIDWEVRVAGGDTTVKLRDAKMLTYLLLKLK
jgi:hypothetical protein